MANQEEDGRWHKTIFYKVRRSDDRIRLFDVEMQDYHAWKIAKRENCRVIKGITHNIYGHSKNKVNGTISFLVTNIDKNIEKIDQNGQIVGKEQITQ